MRSESDGYDSTDSPSAGSRLLGICLVYSYQPQDLDELKVNEGWREDMSEGMKSYWFEDHPPEPTV